MKEALLKEIESTRRAFEETLGAFAQEQIDVVPFEGSWTAGQVGEHITRADEGVAKGMQQDQGEADRSLDKNVELLRKIFLDYTHKLQSPDFILPKEDKHDKAALIKLMNDSMHGIAASISNDALTHVCFEMPRMGKLTRYEAAWFAVYHTQRHTQQLKNIFDKLQS